MLVLIQIVGWLACGILAVLAFIIAYSNLFRDDKGDQPQFVTAVAFGIFIGAASAAFGIAAIGENIKKEMERATTNQMIEDLRRAAKGY